MEKKCNISFLLAFCLLSFVINFSSVISQDDPSLPLKAANLGGWLVMEGWMVDDTLFSNIPNHNLLDGTRVQFRSAKFNNYLSADGGGGAFLKANIQNPSKAKDSWETFRLWRISESVFNFRVANKQFLGRKMKGQGLSRRIEAVSKTANRSETFEIVTNGNNNNVLHGDKVRIKILDGLFLEVLNETHVVAKGEEATNWANDDPTVFVINILDTMRGEYQITNGYGPDIAPQKMREHWNSFITEYHFKKMRESGINAVRIPVGWWIKSASAPFVGGSKEYLDKAFDWADAYGLKVIVDLHAVPGSQNGNDHSGTRDGFQEWNTSRIAETVKTIEFLAINYASRSSLIAIELMNEPFASDGVTVDALTNFYKLGYEAVRRHTQTAYVIMSTRLGRADPREFLSLGKSLPRSVIDIHYYSVYDQIFAGKGVDGNIAFIKYDRANELDSLKTPNGALVFVGEWVAEVKDWNLQNRTKEDYQKFAKAQLEVYGKTSFGWAYWSYINLKFEKWSLQKMIENGYINLQEI